jgi:hypothetical protein
MLIFLQIFSSHPLHYPASQIKPELMELSTHPIELHFPREGSMHHGDTYASRFQASLTGKKAGRNQEKHKPKLASL